MRPCQNPRQCRVGGPAGPGGPGVRFYTLSKDMALETDSQGASGGGFPRPEGPENAPIAKAAPSQAEGAAQPQAAVTAPPQAAVAIIRTAGDDPYFLVLRRAVNPTDPWSGHFALPGGRREERDRDILETCIRETLEETGLRLDPAQLVATLPVARAGGTLHATWVAPFLFEIPGQVPITVDTREIAESYWLAAAYLADPANHDMAVMVPRLPHTRFPCIRVGSGAIWGFTYGLLKTLLPDMDR